MMTERSWLLKRDENVVIKFLDEPGPSSSAMWFEIFPVELPKEVTTEIVQRREGALGQYDAYEFIPEVVEWMEANLRGGVPMSGNKLWAGPYPNSTSENGETRFTVRFNCEHDQVLFKVRWF